MKKILLTGGTGFIGKNIVESYLAKKYQIIAPSRLDLDLSNDESVVNFFKNNKNFDVVIHSACKAGHRNAGEVTGLFYTNTRMFFNLVKYSDCFGKLINIGSGAIYDMQNYQPKMKEEFFGNTIPKDEHGFCKYVIGNYIEKSENIVDLRIFGIFGKYEDYAIRFISNVICKTIFDLSITIKQNRKFDYIYVDDLIPILDFFIEQRNNYKSYNITPNSAIELLEIAKIINQISKKNLPINVAQEGFGSEYSGDNSRLKKEINLKFKKIEDSIDELYHWYLINKSSINKQLLLTDK
ncbi:MAG: NAD(P)-dependent oxidoreductase [Rickettsiales bacterium]|nr:NAD(P)-dependent oxidoreductase [Rickettsiales bacterium]